MDPQQQFCLKWNSFGSNLVTTFDSLFKSESLTDVTLFCEGVTFKAHKLILAACSKHFQDLFEAAPHCPSVLVILDGTSSSNMSALLEFMYKGEVHVSHESLSSFLKAAECLQVKGLSIEHEKLAAAQTQAANNELPGSESPRGGKSKCSMTLTSNGSMKDGVSERENSGEMLPPSTSSPYTPPVLSPYMHHYMVAAYEQRVPASSYDNLPRKRHHRSPSDPMRNSSMRASVLRDGSKPERESPLSLAYHQAASPQPPPYQSPRYETTTSSDTPASAPTPTPVSSVPFDRSAAVESDTPPDLWRSSSCPEDLSVKVEPPGSERVIKNEWGYTETNTQQECQPPDIMSSNVWNCSSSTKLSTAHKGAPTATTPDGKKLQCPFCERLYGYETNLRAHIRQRHQGIRVPCPFCSRTFTRNNTVRRHIAREHKTELSLKALQSAQVQNHNQ
ncbi:zinc finger protein chinmo [Cimex lectularius]|uniref:Zinc finger protein chinmo n=1 Tax=Cimex lectularius TaxID=79782 RepID=A0A8I6TGC3_CIMLE|nr:zinc finger protein chinmo [Cimex lectularius]XP_014248103.1 zinc finger protein chinmo [Cimex lectularius]